MFKCQPLLSRKTNHGQLNSEKKSCTTLGPMALRHLLTVLKFCNKKSYLDNGLSASTGRYLGFDLPLTRLFRLFFRVFTNAAVLSLVVVCKTLNRFELKYLNQDRDKSQRKHSVH